MARHLLEPRKHRTIAALLAVAALTVMGLTVASGPAGAFSPIMGGRAFTLSSTGALKIAPVSDTGTISTQNATLVDKCAIPFKIGTVAAVTGICADVATFTTPGANVAAGASVANLNVNVPGLPAIVLRSVSAGSGTSCGGSNGTSEIGFLKIGSKVVIGNLVHPAPNSTLRVGTIKVILNEQASVPGSLLVDAVHISAGTLLNLIVAQARTSITC